MLYEYKQKYESHPSEEDIASYVRSELDKFPQPIQMKIASFFVQMKNDTDTSGIEYTKDKSLDFFKKRAVENACLEALELAEEGSFEELRKKIENALRMGQDNDLGYDYHNDIDDRYGGKDRDFIPTGQPVFDRLLKGGWGRKEFHVLIAPTNAGKTGSLAYAAAQCLHGGQNVVICTFEETAKKYARRIDAALLKVEQDDLEEHFGAVRDRLSHLEGQLKIKEYPIRGATVGIIRHYLEKCIRTDFVPDILIVDYADLIRPANRFETSRHGYQEIYEDLRGLAFEFNIAVISATQTNRAGVDIEVVTMEHIAEAYSKCWNADFIWTLSNKAKIYIAKNRNGPKDHVYPCNINHGRVQYVIEDQEISETIGKMANGKKNEDKNLLKKLMLEFGNQGFSEVLES